MASSSKTCALAVSALLFATTATAAPSREDRETARRLMDEGTARMKANDPVRAEDAFQKAHDIMHVPTTGLALAKAHLAAGHLVEAHEAALDVVRTQREAGEPAVFDKARRKARELEAQVKPRIPTLKIHVRGGDAKSVTVDDNDVPLELAAEPVPVNPGKHVVTAKATDGTSGEADVDVREGEKKDVDVVLSGKSDTKTKDASPAPDPSSPAPKKVIGFGNDDDGIHARGRSPLAEGLIVGGFSAGALGLGIGAVTGIMTLSKASSVSGQCENDICAPAAKNDLNSANTLATVSTIAFGVGIAGIGLGVLGLVMPKSGSTRGALTIHPTFDGVGGTF